MGPGDVRVDCAFVCLGMCACVCLPAHSFVVCVSFVCSAASPGGAVCAGCQKRVYAMDPQMGFEGAVFHQSCFKCTHCKSQLTLLTFAQVNGIPYCKAHYMELFMSTSHGCVCVCLPRRASVAAMS